MLYASPNRILNAISAWMRVLFSIAINNVDYELYITQTTIA